MHASVGKRGCPARVCAVFLTAALAIVPSQGCTPSVGQLLALQPDLGAIATVVTDAYRTQGLERPVLFLDMGGVCDSVSPSCNATDGGVPPALKTRLETDLDVKVRPRSEANLGDLSVPALTPVLPDTGEIGVSVSLGRFREQDDGSWHVNVTVARSGLDGVFVEYILQPLDGSWNIVDTIYDEAVP